MNAEKIDHKNIFYPPGGILIWMIIFLELTVFVIALITLAVYSKNDPENFHASRLLLNPVFGVLNTIFLLTSGFFMAESLKHFRNGQLKRCKSALNFTLLGGFLFLVIKTVEYSQKLSHGITLEYDTFFSFYWLLTGFHVVHVIVGLGILVSVYFGLKKNKVILEDFEAGAAFWHMCDLIWLLIFPMLYLVL